MLNIQYCVCILTFSHLSMMLIRAEFISVSSSVACGAAPYVNAIDLIKLSACHASSGVRALVVGVVNSVYRVFVV